MEIRNVTEKKKIQKLRFRNDSGNQQLESFVSILRYFLKNREQNFFFYFFRKEILISEDLLRRECHDLSIRRTQKLLGKTAEEAMTNGNDAK